MLSVVCGVMGCGVVMCGTVGVISKSSRRGDEEEALYT